MAKSVLPDTTIVIAAEVPEGTFTPPYGRAIPEVPAFCRVAGVLHPTPDSHILFEVWMPAKGWNGKFAGIGNGGFAGVIGYEAMAGALRRGFATAATDTGHQAEAEDASWAYHHPEKIVDFGYRAIHLTAERAKYFIQTFYGNAAKKSYFDACSDGGREALMEAQRFPEDYDGILAGAPANYWTHMVAAGIDVEKAVLADPRSYISSMKLPAVTAAVLAACDAQDGLKDGILNDPRECHFDPASLLCKGPNSLSCLTAPQVAALKKLYSGGKSAQGKTIFPGFMPGNESPSWNTWVIGEAPGAGSGVIYLQNYFRYMVFDDATWNPLTANVDLAVRAADAKTAKALNATDADLSRFAARGGKLILYHGWNDQAISPLNTISYYESVQTRMGAQKTAEFVRLYMVPGMEHCALGPGPNAFGQLGIPTAKGPAFGAFTALEEWVEDGKPAGEVIATKYFAPGKVQMTRPLCPYPQIAKYKGEGDVNAVESFACVAPHS